ncbi:MAG: glycosyltransferase family 39 protein [Candidatus Binatia bacterium]|nr:glycosyltransferase family 39 protein [Candidatus Binatia bacterium]
MTDARTASSDGGLLGLAQSIATASQSITEVGTWWLMSAVLLVGVGCIIGQASSLRTERGSDRGLLIAGLLFVGALLVRALLPPWTHYTYNDEYLYLRYAHELGESGTFSFENQPPLLIYLYALAFRGFSASAQTTSAITSIAGSLTVAALYGCLRSLRVDRTVAVLAAALLAVHPLHVKHSGASSLEVMSLLFLVASVGTFARWLRTNGTLSLLSFAVCLFGALTTRIENFALVPIFGGLALVGLEDQRRPTLYEFSMLGLVVLTAGLYLPSVLLFHGDQAGWWKSELSAVALLANNLKFWIGGGLSVGKLPFLLLAGGVVGSWRTSRTACVTWLVLLFTYSAIYVVHGANLGYHHESTHPPYFAARASGHDMFRFNVPLLPAIVFFLASGIVSWVSLIDSTLRKITARTAPAVSVAILILAGAVLLGASGEYAAYDPAGFIGSAYNRPIERAEFEFLETELRSAPRPVRCYMLPASTEPFLRDGIEIVAVNHADEISVDGMSSFFYVNSAQLMNPRLRTAFDQVRRKFSLDPVAKTAAGPLELELFRLRSRG